MHFIDGVPLVLAVAPDLIRDLNRTGAPHALNLQPRKWPAGVAILLEPVKFGHCESKFLPMLLRNGRREKKSDLPLFEIARVLVCLDHVA